MPLYKDVIRVCDTKANVALTLREKMIGFCTDTFEVAVKAPGGTMYYFPATGSNRFTNLYIDEAIKHYGDDGNNIAFTSAKMVINVRNQRWIELDGTSIGNRMELNPDEESFTFRIHATGGKTLSFSSAGGALVNTGDIYTTVHQAFTPVLSGLSGGIPPTYSSNLGYYKKIGKQVSGWFRFSGQTAGGSGANDLLLTLPVPTANLPEGAWYQIGNGYIERTTCSGTTSGAMTLDNYESLYARIKIFGGAMAYIDTNNFELGSAMGGTFLYEGA